MRLTCPNCGAQYEVPAEVIPFAGRDVQCSNCGDTWFQGHPDNPNTIADPETTIEPESESVSEPEAVSTRPDAAIAEPEATETRAEAAPEIPLEPEQSAPMVEDSVESARPFLDNQPPTSLPDIDSGITDILRQEAEREAHLRATESDPLESQPDLGLDEAGAAPDQQSKRARRIISRLRKEEGDGEAEAGTRRELLPDIEEINSAWSSPEETVSTEVAMAEEQSQQQRSGFVRGFAIIVIIGMLMALLYANAPKISELVPAAKPALGTYVTMIDQARFWLDAKLGDMVPTPSE